LNKENTVIPATELLILKVNVKQKYGHSGESRNPGGLCTPFILRQAQDERKSKPAL
jgi:hypothetical protein